MLAISCKFYEYHKRQLFQLFLEFRKRDDLIARESLRQLYYPGYIYNYAGSIRCFGLIHCYQIDYHIPTAFDHVDLCN
jgi:hypothetical protein